MSIHVQGAKLRREAVKWRFFMENTEGSYFHNCENRTPQYKCSFLVKKYFLRESS
jgi:hypothetical protein